MGNNHSTNHFSLDDIVFEGRNRAYGAYLLRKLYNQNLLKATLLATALFLLLLCVPIAYNYFKPAEAFQPIVKDPGGLVISTVNPVIEKPKVIEPAKTETPTPPAKTKVNTTEFKDPKVVANDKAPETTNMPNQRDLKDKNIGLTEITDGDAIPTLSDDTGNNSSNTNTGTANTTAEAAVYVEKMPTFGDSEADILRYLSKNIRYPDKARTMGVEGLVVLTFVVGTDGNISKVNVVKGLGYGTEEEAKRVLEKMPKWNPGYQNGTAVPVKITLPIRFNIMKN